MDKVSGGHKEVIAKLRHLLGHKSIVLGRRGNNCILAAIRSVKLLNPDRKRFLIPDQGGWLTYKNYPKKAKLDMIEAKTDRGLIDLNQLKETSNSAAGIIIENPAGYFANQDIEQIYEVCNKNGCLVIMDVSGCIGDKKHCDGRFADIMVCSFGKGKAIDLGYGGLITYKDKENYEKCIEILSKLSFDEDRYGDLLAEIELLPKRLDYLYKACAAVKEDLKEKGIIYKDRKGINVVVGFSSEKEKDEIIDYCSSKGYEYTICPRYIRVLEDAVSIEVKRLILEVKGV